LLVISDDYDYVMDRGYLDFARLYLLHQAHVSSPLHAPSRTPCFVASIQLR